jgi:hypothetical protein
MLESNLTKITDKLDMSDSERCGNWADHRVAIPASRVGTNVDFRNLLMHGRIEITKTNSTILQAAGLE